MMTREEELKRLYEDRDMNETDLELYNEELKALDEESEEYDDLCNEISALENEIMYQTACIISIEGGYE